MKRYLTSFALVASTSICLSACSKHDAQGNSTAPAVRHAQLDPNPPMSSHDIDSIVAQSRQSGRPKSTPQAPAPQAVPTATAIDGKPK